VTVLAHLGTFAISPSQHAHQSTKEETIDCILIQWLMAEPPPFDNLDNVLEELGFLQPERPAPSHTMLTSSPPRFGSAPPSHARPWMPSTPTHAHGQYQHHNQHQPIASQRQTLPARQTVQVEVNLKPDPRPTKKAAIGDQAGRPAQAQQQQQQQLQQQQQQQQQQQVVRVSSVPSSQPLCSPSSPKPSLTFPPSRPSSASAHVALSSSLASSPLPSHHLQLHPQHLSDTSSPSQSSTHPQAIILPFPAGDLPKRFTATQLEILESEFARNPSPNPTQVCSALEHKQHFDLLSIDSYMHQQ
jgi:hypothetical protein